MSKSKKSSKSAKIPQPIKVKKEKSEEDRAIHSMAHYVDDRLELVKQIFGSLKKKTITNLAPEYLKEMEMEEVQELCLNELLCLSKKRLLSIINATKCPTDTESSDDSDVQAKEEHVSLEEISSDSEIENGAKVSKKSSGGSQSRIKKISKKANQSDGKTEPEGQISVLELLELQARARAIRSQLALEPVTKIEVDSDTETDRGNSKQKTTTTTASTTQPAPPSTTTTTAVKEKEKDNAEKSKKSHKKQNDSKKSSSASKEKNSDKSKESESVKSTEMSPKTSNGNTEQQIRPQKIKIKRNFRKSNQTEENNAIELNKNENEKEKDLMKTIEKTPSNKDVKKEKRSPSPDVIPIVAEPETFCISDSNSENENTIITKPASPSPSSSSSSSSTSSQNEETEDGEIIEKKDTKKNNNEIKIDEEKIENENHKDEAATATIVDEPTKDDSIEKNQQLNDKDTKMDEQLENQTIISPKSPLIHDQHNQNQHNDNDNDDDEHSDDVISIEGGDLENEMSEHLDEEANSNQSTKQITNNEQNNQNDDKTNKDNDIDIVSLDSSENEDETGNDRNKECWNTRYMSSSKVKKVLAVSRLGKRVRDKLKTSSRSKSDSNSDKSAKDESKTLKYTSKHEDGSVDQYKELIKMSQRKS